MASPPSLGARRSLLQDSLGGGLPIASPQLQKSLHGRGRVVLVVVVGVREDSLPLFEEAIHQPGPPAQVIVSVLLEMGVPLRELAAVAEPADVGEVRGSLFKPRHLGVIDEGESRPVLAQQLGKVGADPTPVAYLDGVTWSLGQFPQESVQDLHALDGEARRELEEQGTKPV